MTGLEDPRIAFALQCELVGEGGVGIVPAVAQQRGARGLPKLGDRGDARVSPQPLRPRTLRCLVPVKGPGGDAVAAIALSMPTVRYEPGQVGGIVAALETAAKGISERLRATVSGTRAAGQQPGAE